MTVTGAALAVKQTMALERVSIGGLDAMLVH